MPNFIPLIYGQIGLPVSDLVIDREGNAYDACSFKLYQKIVVYRTAKITPKKIGQFVSIWKRNELGITMPHHINDNFDFMIINCDSGSLTGQFIFPKQALLENHIISSDLKEGKRGFRVYPPWDAAVNNQARKTQKWQVKYFVDFSNSNELDFARVKFLLKA